MSWGKLDDPHDPHPRITAAWRDHPAAVGLHAMATTRARRGFVDDEWVEERLILAGISTQDRPAVLAALTDGRRGPLFTPVAGGYLVLQDAPDPVARSTRANREATAPGWATRAQIAARVAFYGGICWICRVAPADTLDHVKPLAAGGSKWAANLRPACRSCNSRKGARWPFRRTDV